MRACEDRKTDGDGLFVFYLIGTLFYEMPMEFWLLGFRVLLMLRMITLRQSFSFVYSNMLSKGL